VLGFAATGREEDLKLIINALRDAFPDGFSNSRILPTRENDGIHVTMDVRVKGVR
jgi:hypothetical protein